MFQQAHRPAEDKKQVAEELERNYQIQSVINSLLHLSLEDIPLEELLQRALDLILSIRWLAFESKGSIFLAEEDSDVLVMKAQSGLLDILLKECARFPFGKCLCGQAASQRKMQFEGCINDKHLVRYEGMMPHGHYCVPVILADKVLGVINMYVKENHQRSEPEEKFLTAVADALAGVIKRKKAEEALRVAYHELKETQTQLIQVAKMQVVGGLASGVAHEVKNPLAIILQGVDYLSSKIKTADDNVSFALQNIHDAVKRADTIIKGLLDFSSISRMELKPQSLNSVLDNALLLLKNQFTRYHIHVIEDFGKDMPDIIIDKNRIEQVFINIFINAIQAMPDGGTLTVRTFLKGSTLGVEVEDTGKGILEDILDKVFDPFFTTKRNIGGTGLGLSIVKNIIEMHKGTIKIENKKEGGVKVAVSFKADQKGG